MVRRSKCAAVLAALPVFVGAGVKDIVPVAKNAMKPTLPFIMCTITQPVIATILTTNRPSVQRITTPTQMRLRRIAKT
ncbi:hypothetical protein DdX_15686 [Ditylenchus destructor]|uniref:Uncharacterized protein n=1 Tax=Ditylenchus destructor TaxID=166010 RepID=A0AAD4R0S0_9BILA|nr:hypothetical protein DdX_15686 [Ditylenchus destructor]